MGILDKLSGQGYAILIQRDGVPEEVGFETWGRLSILGARFIHTLVLPTIKIYSEELGNTSYLTLITTSHKSFSMHTAALKTACDLVAICSQSTNSAKIFKRMIDGCRAGLIEHGFTFSEFPEIEYREGIFSLIHRYSNILLAAYQSQSGDRETKLKFAAREVTTAFIVLISEDYPHTNGMTIAEAYSNAEIRMQLNVIYAAVEKWIVGNLTNNTGKLLS